MLDIERIHIRLIREISFPYSYRACVNHPEGSLGYLLRGDEAGLKEMSNEDLQDFLDMCRTNNRRPAVVNNLLIPVHEDDYEEIENAST